MEGGREGEQGTIKQEQVRKRTREVNMKENKGKGKVGGISKSGAWPRWS